MRSLIVAAAIVTTVLAAGLRPDAFFSGDCGVKLIAARHAALHPTRPFEIDLPRLDGGPLPFVNHMLPVHGDHAHPAQSPIFPLLSAPLVAAFGLHGAYVIPALSFLALIPVMDRLRRKAAPSAPAWAMGLAVTIANPLFFYAFEFWEHVPAALLLAVATVAGWSHGRWAPLTCGLAAGGAALLRPEAVWYGAALAVAAPMRSIAARAAILAGMVVALLPPAIYNLLHLGDPLGVHVGSNVASIDDRWFASRLSSASLWFAAAGPAARIGFAAIALSWIAWPLGHRRAAQAAGLTGAALVALTAALGLTPRDSLWLAWTAGVLAFVPHHSADARRLQAILLITGAATFLSSPHSGGAQWGPRFLLNGAPAMIALAAVAIARLTQPGDRMRAMRVALVAAVLLCAAATSRAAYKELRGSKEAYGAIVDATRETVPEGGLIVTDIWWFDQITAALHERHTVLVASERHSLDGVVAAVEQARVPHFVLAQTAEQPGAVAGDLGCYKAIASRRVPVRAITLTTFAAAACAPSAR